MSHGASDSAGSEVGLPDPIGREDAVPWLLALGPPFAFLAVLAVRYALTSAACELLTVRLLLETAPAAGLLLVARSGLAARRRLGAESAATTSDAPGVEASHRLLLELALLGSVFFGLVTLAVWLPSLLLSPCG